MDIKFLFQNVKDWLRESPVWFLAALSVVGLALSLFVFLLAEREAEQARLLAELAVKQEKLDAIVERVGTADRSPLSEKEKKDIINFVSDPSIQNLSLSEEEKLKLLRVLREQ